MLKEKHISVKPTKAFLAYPTVRLLGEKVISLGLSILEENWEQFQSLNLH